MLAVISDTHGMMRPEVLHALHDCESIIHAGDIGSPEVLDRLTQIAPVHAIRGNIDTAAWSLSIPEKRTVIWMQQRILIAHRLSDVQAQDLEEIDLLVCGHSHKPFYGYHLGTRYLNPGSIGPKRFRLPITCARLYLEDSNVEVAWIVLDDRGREVRLGPGWDNWVVI
ncbi:MAG: metallophosphoesterase family protein [Myxococcota bacterium]|nr:metallophosphoesterase family protein [Myxococcota bacterium]